MRPCGAAAGPGPVRPTRRVSNPIRSRPCLVRDSIDPPPAGTHLVVGACRLLLRRVVAQELGLCRRAGRSDSVTPRQARSTDHSTATDERRPQGWHERRPQGWHAPQRSAGEGREPSHGRPRAIAQHSDGRERQPQGQHPAAGRSRAAVTRRQARVIGDAGRSGARAMHRAGRSSEVTPRQARAVERRAHKSDDPRAARSKFQLRQGL